MSSLSIRFGISVQEVEEDMRTEVLSTSYPTYSKKSISPMPHNIRVAVNLKS